MKILAVHSPSTHGATQRMADICRPDIEMDVVDQWPASTSSYDGIIVHNRPDIREGERTVWYPCGMPMNRMIQDTDYRDAILRRHPKAIWTNSHTSEAAVAAIVPETIEVKCMQKPFILEIPDGPLPQCNEKRILWYWKPEWQYTDPCNEQIFEIMRELHDYEIWQISNKRAGYTPPGPGLGHVWPKGRIEPLSQALPFVQGMVRATDGLDFGRSTFQVLAYGRWVMYVGFQDPNVIGAKSFERVAELVRMMYSSWTTDAAQRAHDYVAKHFTEEGLNKTWVSELHRVFGG